MAKPMTIVGKSLVAFVLLKWHFSVFTIQAAILKRG